MQTTTRSEQRKDLAMSGAYDGLPNLAAVTR